MPSSRIKRFNGTSWVDFYDVRKFNGANWINAEANRWDGKNWVPVIDRTPNTTSRQSSWVANWIGSYNESGVRIRTDDGYQGRYDSTHGNQKSMWGFPHANIRAALAGSQIDSVMLWFRVEHSYYPVGAYFDVGTHNYSGTTSPTTYQALVSPSLLRTPLVPRGSSDYASAPNVVATQFRDGLAKGLVLDTDSNSLQFYGSVSAMTLIVNYTK